MRAPIHRIPAVGLLVLTAALHVAPFAAAQGEEAPPAAAAAADAAETVAARAVGAPAAAGGLLEGARGIVTFDQLDELLLWRDGMSPIGQRSLQQLLEVRLVEHLGSAAKIVITEVDVAKRTAALDDEIRAGGKQGGLEELMREGGVKLEDFRRYLRLSLVHEELTRRALEIPAGTEVTPDQQELWLQNQLKERGTQAEEFPWTKGVVVTSGDLTITRDEFAAHIRGETPENEQREACYLLLLERAVRARMPELGEAGAAAALDREMERRRAEAEADPKFRGAAYEQILTARGLSVEAVRRDPAIQAAALAHEAVDREHDDESLRAEYEKERRRFDSLFGEAVEVRILYMNASPRPDDPLRPSFKAVEEKLRELREGIRSPEDFLAAVEIHSQDRGTRERKGSSATSPGRATPRTSPACVRPPSPPWTELRTRVRARSSARCASPTGPPSRCSGTGSRPPRGPRCARTSTRTSGGASSRRPFCASRWSVTSTRNKRFDTLAVPC